MLAIVLGAAILLGRLKLDERSKEQGQELDAIQTLCGHADIVGIALLDRAMNQSAICDDVSNV